MIIPVIILSYASHKSFVFYKILLLKIVALLYKYTINVNIKTKEDHSAY